MPKLEITAVVDNGERPGFQRFRVSYSADALDIFHSYLGCTWDASERCWYVPEEFTNDVVDALHRCGIVAIRARESESNQPTAGGVNGRLHLYQQEAVRSACHTPAWMLAFEMGLGKTATAIEIVRLTQGKAAKVLVVCPALVRGVWEDEFGKWWPEHPSTFTQHHGKMIYAGESIAITSYELLGRLPDEGWTHIILDESHYIKNGSARRSKIVRKLCLKNPNARKLALTATPIMSEPKDLWHQLDCFWPGRFGSYWNYCRTYSVLHENMYGTEVKGLNPLTEEELCKRLKSVATRVTKQEVAHLLPPFLVQCIRIRPTSAMGSQRELSDTLSSGLRKQHELDLAVEHAGGQKIGRVVEMVQETQDAGTTHIAVLTHFKSTAQRIVTALGDTVPVHYISGDLPIKQRMALIETARRQPASVIVCTMHSINVGIDLTKFTVAIFAELYWQPASMIQALGRFSRLSSKVPSSCYLLVLQGTLDEPIAHVLMRRLRDQSKLFKAGVAEEKLNATLDPANMSEDEFLSEMQEAVKSRREELYL